MKGEEVEKSLKQVKNRERYIERKICSEGINDNCMKIQRQREREREKERERQRKKAVTTRSSALPSTGLRQVWNCDYWPPLFAIE